MTSFFTDENGVVRVIPDGIPNEKYRAQKSKQTQSLTARIEKKDPVRPTATPKSPTGTRPATESDALHQRIFRANEAMGPVTKESAKPIKKDPYRRALPVKIEEEYLPEQYPIDVNQPLKRYPDITENLQAYTKYVLAEIEGKGPSEWFKFLKFAPKNEWDLKGQPGIPPVGRWGRYKGEMVSDAYAANNLFGQAAAKNGMTLEEALGKAQAFSFLSRNFVFDQPEDQAAIISGYNEYKTGNPWPAGLRTPDESQIIKEKAPNYYKGLVPEIKDFLKYFSD